MITSVYLKDKFGDLYDPVRLDLDADKNGIYNKDTGYRVAARMPWARYVFRSFENGRPILSRVYKVRYSASENDSAALELETIFKLRQAGVAAIPRICRVGLLERGGLWAELEGIENARSLDREIFGRVPRFFDVMIKAAEILQAIHAQGVVHGDVKPGNILINKQQEIEWIDFEREKATEGFGALDENNEPIIESQGRDTDTFGFIMTLANMMDDLVKGNAVSDAAKPLFQRIRDGYLELILEKFPDDAHFPRCSEPFKHFPAGFIQKSRSQWPQDMEIILRKLRSDREEIGVVQGR